MNLVDPIKDPQKIREIKEILVTCPECGARISEEADLCPRCGLVNAGLRSREYNEYWIEKEKKHTRPLAGRFGEADCGSCGWVGNPDSEPIKMEVVKRMEGAGYGAKLCFRCPKCGGLVYIVSHYH